MDPQLTTSIQKKYTPYEILKTNTISIDNPLFHSFDLNLIIMTKFGKFVFIRHGDENRCSSFCATISTVVRKLQLSFGSEESPAQLKKITQGKLQFYVLKRMNFIYIFWSKARHSDLRLFSMVEMVHYQLMSCLTAKVNAIIQQNQTYDPTINFGKGPAVVNLLTYALQNGLNSLPILFSAVPVLHLSAQTRNQISTILNVRDSKSQGLQVSILMTMNCLVCLSKQKTIQINNKDLFLFSVLLQAQSMLSKSQNWFPVCLPGIEPDSMIFSYINFLDDELIHIMISDESDIFSELSRISKQVKAKLEDAGLIAKIRSASSKELIEDPSFQKSNVLTHFVIRNQAYNQMVMSQGQYFGNNRNASKSLDFDEFHNIYGELYEHLVTVKHNRKEKLHVQPFQKYKGGYYEQGNTCIFFITSRLSDFQQVKSVIYSILKFAKDEDISLFITKY